MFPDRLPLLVVESPPARSSLLCLLLTDFRTFMRVFSRSMASSLNLDLLFNSKVSRLFLFFIFSTEGPNAQVCSLCKAFLIFLSLQLDTVKVQGITIYFLERLTSAGDV